MRRLPVSILVPALVLLTACGGGSSSSPAAPSGPATPAGLVAHGSLGHIQLTWSASTQDTGYNLYRSGDGTTWTKLNGAALASGAYDDAIASPAGDGIAYAYRVTGLKGADESSPSAAVRCMHGTRLPASITAGFTTVAADSPYVAEGTVAVNGGNLVVDTGTALYVADHASLDLEAGDGTTAGRLWVKGLFRVTATPSAPAAFTAHKTGGLANNEGFAFWFDNAVSFNPADGSGTLLQNATITNLAYGGSYGGFSVFNCAPKLYNLHATANASTGTAYLFFFSGASGIVENCDFSHLALSVQTDLHGTGFKLDHNRFRGGYYAIAFLSAPSPAVDAGQIADNDFDGSQTAYVYNISGSSNLPLGGNYWNGGVGSPPVPSETTGLTTVHCDFTTALGSAPSGAGPTW